MKTSAFRSILALTGLALLGLAAGPARAQLVITPTFLSSITGDPNATAIEGVINQAIQEYQTKFSDPINVQIEFGSMTTGLGSSFWGFYNLPYATFQTALALDKTSADDTTALSLLPASATNPVNGAGTINVKTANLRAVGLSFAGFIDGSFDGRIGLNTHITDIGSPGTTGQYSLKATVEHEIDEVLGLGSSLAGVPFQTIFPEDLYRYNSTGGRSFTSSSTAQAFFSINGTTLLAQFDNQNDGGDFGDWQSNPRPLGVQPKVQDAFATPGAHPTLGVELTALDVIGYTFAQQAPPGVPEPGSLAMLGGMLVPGILFVRRLRK